MRMSTKVLCSSSKLWMAALFAGVLFALGSRLNGAFLVNVGNMYVASLAHGAPTYPESVGEIRFDRSGTQANQATTWLHRAVSLAPDSQAALCSLARLLLFRSDYPGFMRLVDVDSMASSQLDDSFPSRGGKDESRIGGLSDQSCRLPGYWRYEEWMALWADADREWASGRLAHAVVIYRKALAQTGVASPKAHEFYATVLKTWTEHELTLHPEDSDMLFRHANSCRLLDDRLCARRSFQRLLDESSASSAQRALAFQYIALQQPSHLPESLVLSYLEEAISSGAGLPEAYARLADLYALQSDLEKAEQVIAALDALSPEVTLPPDQQIMPSGWILLGYTIVPWADVANDPLLEMVLFWRPPADLDFDNGLPNGWVRSGGRLLQHGFFPNLAPDPGFEWQMAGVGRLPFGYNLLSSTSPVQETQIVKAQSPQGGNGQVLRLANREVTHFGLESRSIPVSTGVVYLQAADIAGGEGNPGLGRAWRGNGSYRAFGYVHNTGCQTGEWCTMAGLALPLDEETTVVRIWLVNNNSSEPAEFDNILFVQIGDPPLTGIYRRE